MKKQKNNLKKKKATQEDKKILNLYIHETRMGSYKKRTVSKKLIGMVA